MAQIPVLTINLDRREDRLAETKALFDAAGVVFERVPGVDGSKLTEIEKRVFCPNRLWIGRHYMSDGEIGCFWSHVNCLQIGLERGWERWCVTEDDIKLRPGFSAWLDDGLELPPGVELLKLEGLQGRAKVDWGVSIGDVLGAQIVATNLPRAGAACYIVTRKAAERLLDGMLPMREPLDEAMFNYRAVGLIGFEVCPVAALQRSSESDLNEGRREGRSQFESGKIPFLIKLRWDTVRRWARISNRLYVLRKIGLRYLFRKRFDFFSFEKK